MAGSVGPLGIELGLDQTKFTQGLDKAHRSATKFAEQTNKQLDSIRKNVETLSGTTDLAERLFKLDVAKSAVIHILKQADTYTELKNRIALVTAEETARTQALQTMFDISMRTNQSIDATSTIYQRFAQNADTLGLSQQRVASLTETVSKAVAISGASSASASAALMQFGQSLASGIFRGQEFNSVMEQTPGLAYAIANGLGVSIGELRVLANEGKLTMDVLIPALEKAKGSVDSQFATRVLTVSAAFENLKTQSTKWVGEMNESIGGTEKLAGLIGTLADHFNVLGTAAVAAGTGIGLIKLTQYANQTRQASSATLAAAQAEQAKTAAKLRSIQTSQSLLKTQLQLAATEQQRIAIRKIMEAQSTRITQLTNLEAAANTKLAAARKSANLFGGALGFVGGGVGLLTTGLFAGAGALYAWYQETEQAKERAISYADELVKLKETIKDMDSVTLAATQAKTNESIEAQQAKIQKLQREYDDLAEKIKNTPKVTIIEDDYGFEITIDNTKKLIRLNGELAIKAEELRDKQETLNNTIATGQEVTAQLAIVTEMEMIATMERFGIAALNAEGDQDKFNNAMLVAANISEKVQSPLQGMMNKVLGVGDAARASADDLYIFSHAYRDFLKTGNGTPLPTMSEENQKLLNDITRDNQITSAKNAKNKGDWVRLNVEKALAQRGVNSTDVGYAEIAAGYTTKFEDDWDRQQNTKSSSHSKSKSSPELRREWLDYYNEIQRANADAVSNITLNEQRSFDELEKHLKTGVVSHQEAEAARTLITERYAKERSELVARYFDHEQARLEQTRALYEIDQLKQAGVMTGAQAKEAKDKVNMAYAQDSARSAVSTRDQVLAIYDPMQEIANQHAQELAQLQAFKDTELLTIEEYEKRKQEIINRYRNDRWQKEAEAYTQGLGDISSAFGTLASAAEQSAGKQSSAYKAMFAISKGFAIAESSLKLSQAIMQAMAAPESLTPAQKFANMAAVAAAGANVISQITSIGFSSGGYTGDGGKYTPAGIVHKGEYVITKEATSRLGLDYLNYLNYGRRGFASGGGVAVPRVPSMATNIGSATNQSNEVNITIHIDRNGDSQASVETQAQQGKQLGNLIQAKVLEVLAREKRVGGMLAM